MTTSELQFPELAEEKPKSLQEAKKKAIGYLSRREHGCYELQRKLVRSGFNSEIAQATIKDFQHRGLISDNRFTEAYIRYRSSKGFGPVRIQMELGEKGVDSALVETALMQSARNWIELATLAREKKYGTNIPDDFKERARQARFLQYRGFRSEQIQQALSGNE